MWLMVPSLQHQGPVPRGPPPSAAWHRGTFTRNPGGGAPLWAVSGAWVEGLGRGWQYLQGPRGQAERCGVTWPEGEAWPWYELCSEQVCGWSQWPGAAAPRPVRAQATRRCPSGGSVSSRDDTGRGGPHLCPPVQPGLEGEGWWEPGTDAVDGLRADHAPWSRPPPPPCPLSAGSCSGPRRLHSARMNNAFMTRRRGRQSDL